MLHLKQALRQAGGLTSQNAKLQRFHWHQVVFKRLDHTILYSAFSRTQAWAHSGNIVWGRYALRRRNRRHREDALLLLWRARCRPPSTYRVPLRRRWTMRSTWCAAVDVKFRKFYVAHTCTRGTCSSRAWALCFEIRKLISDITKRLLRQTWLNPLSSLLHADSNDAQ